MTKFTKKLGLGLVASAMAFSAQALIIDDFSDDQAQLDDVTADNSGLWSQTTGSMLGGYRDMFVTKVSGTVSTTQGVSMLVENGVLAFDSDSGQAGVGIVRWDGATAGTGTTLAGAIASIDGDGLGGVNLFNQGVGFLISVLSADLAFDFTLQAYTDNANYSSFTATSGGPGAYFIPFIAFGSNVGSGIDWNNVGALQAIINYPSGPVNDVDIQIDIVRTAIPEPASLALVGAALLGLGVASRRRRNRV